MSKTEVSGKQVKDGSIELVDLSTALSNTISGKADASSLATVATSGSYNDLTNKPSIPSVTGLASETYVDTAVAGKADSSSLATVATSGAYADLTGKPTLFDGAYSSLSGAPSIPANLDDLSDVTITSPSANQILKYNGTAWVNDAAPSSFSGSYTDLTNKPTIPSALDDLSDVAVSSAAKGQFIVHNGTSFVNSNTIEASGAAVKPLIVKGAASQTANYYEAQDANAVSVFHIASTSQGATKMGAVLNLKSDGTTAASPYYLKLGTPGNSRYGMFCGVDTGAEAFSTFIGSSAGGRFTGATSGYNVAVGTEAMFGSTGAGQGSAQEGVAVGYKAGVALRGGNANTFLGSWAGSAITSGAANVMIGSYAGAANTTGNYSIHIGYGAGALATAVTANNMISIGYAAKTDGAESIAIGSSASAAANCLDLRFGGATRISGDANGQIGINEATPGAQLQVTSGAAARKGLILKGAASQTAALFETQDSAGNWKSRFQSDGATLRFNYAASSNPILVSNFWDEVMYGVYIGPNSATGNSYIRIGTQVYQFTDFGWNGTNGCFHVWGRNDRVFSMQSPDNGAGVYSFDIARNTGTGVWEIGSGNRSFNMKTATTGGVGINTAPGASFHTLSTSTTRKGMIVQGAASQTANLFEAQNSAGTALTTIASDGTVHAARYTETVANAFDSSLAPSTGTLTVNTASGNAVLGALSAAVTTWAFTNVPTDNSKVTTVTAVLAGNASYTYGDACSVNGSAVTNGIMWSGGSAPTATAGTDIITFIIVKDSAGTVKVFGSATTNFS